MKILILDDLQTVDVIYDKSEVGLFDSLLASMTGLLPNKLDDIKRPEGDK